MLGSQPTPILIQSRLPCSAEGINAADKPTVCPTKTQRGDGNSTSLLESDGFCFTFFLFTLFWLHPCLRSLWNSVQTNENIPICRVSSPTLSWSHLSHPLKVNHTCIHSKKKTEEKWPASSHLSNRFTLFLQLEKIWAVNLKFIPENLSITERQDDHRAYMYALTIVDVQMWWFQPAKTDVAIWTWRDVLVTAMLDSILSETSILVTRTFMQLVVYFGSECNKPIIFPSEI